MENIVSAEQSAINAIVTDQLDVLEYLYMHECSLTSAMWSTAQNFGKTHILEWLESNNCPK